ncbi:MAG: undecaprenyl-diphosphate phosphatase, partial [Acutalibacteraceae bacterium]|nr:undecaprenyl-diphosphate phosphatase [Acutalibacteraceae bacterium]
MLQVFYSFLYGIIEGITEWLPISSTGHLILFEQAVGWKNNEAMTTFLEMFRVVIQLGAIMAVVLLYWNKLWPFSKKKSLKQRNGTLRMWALVIVGCLPAAVIGLLLDDPINDIFYN